MTKDTTMVTNNVFRSTRLFGKGSSNMVLFPLQLMTLRSYMTNYTTMVASWNKLRSIQSLRLRHKRRLWLNSLSLHLFISFMWRNVHRFVLWGRTHNRHKIGYHNMIATNTFINFSNRFNNQTLGMHLKRFIFTFKIINKFVRQNKFSIQVHIQIFKLFQLFKRIFNKILIFLNQFIGFIEFSNQITIIASQSWGSSLIETLSQTCGMLHSSTSKTCIEAYKTLSMAKKKKTQGVKNHT